MENKISIKIVNIKQLDIVSEITMDIICDFEELYRKLSNVFDNESNQLKNHIYDFNIYLADNKNIYMFYTNGNLFEIESIIEKIINT